MTFSMKTDVLFIVGKQYDLDKESIAHYNPKTNTGRFFDAKKFALVVLDEDFSENIKRFVFREHRVGLGVMLLPYQIHALQARMQLG